MTAGIYISQLPASPVLLGTELVPIVTVGTITGITQATFAVVTVNSPASVNPFTVGQEVLFAGVGGMTQINGLGNIGITAVGGSAGAWTLTLDVSSSGFSAYTSGGEVTATAYALTAQFQIAAGHYNPTFQSGNVQYTGSNGEVAGNDNLIFGLAIPNPSGTPGPCLLLGSGGGSGANVSVWYITDQAFDTATPGNDVGFTAGEVQPGSTQRGGNLLFIAGAADLGTAGGGSNTVQGGTGARSPGGSAILQGGGNTDGLQLPGDAFVIGGEEGSQGANVHVAATVIDGIPGVIHIGRFNSTFVQDLFLDGSIYYYGSNGFGSPIAPMISRGAGAAAGWASSSEVATRTVPLAKLTSGGTAGSLTVVNGLITAIVNPT